MKSLQVYQVIASLNVDILLIVLCTIDIQIELLCSIKSDHKEFFIRRTCITCQKSCKLLNIQGVPKKKDILNIYIYTIANNYYIF